MKLFYYKDEVGNFGDDLNPWLWGQLLPDFFDGDERELLIGVGTLLNHKLPTKPIKHVFGSGFGYGTPPVIDETFNFLCVRGPKTAEILNIDSRLALTDPAILVRTVYQPEDLAIPKEFQFGFVPHIQSNKYFSWANICAPLGIHYISTDWPVERVLGEMIRCDVLICEAMHGAIVADALRIPWIPVQCYSHVSKFKWEDWLMTVGLPYSPIRITSIYDIEKHMPIARRGKNILKRHLSKLELLLPDWDKPAPANSLAQDITKATNELRNASRSPPYLSSDNDCDRLTERCLEVLERVKKLKK